MILLDDCSTDGSWEFLKNFKHYPKVSHCIRNESNSGSPFRQWKKGIDLAKYDWIWIAESDDFSHPEFLSSCFELVDQETNLIFCKSNFVDETDKIITNIEFIKEMDEYSLPENFDSMDGFNFIREYLSKKNYILNASGVFFRKPDIIPAEILSMKFCGDWYFWIFILNQGKLKIVNNSLNYFRFHLNSTRNYTDTKNEFLRFQEYMFCFKYAFSFFKFYDLLQVNIDHYNEYIANYFNYSFKLGRFRKHALFPYIPWLFYPKYYLLFLRSIIRD